jgi:hypothetical protein
MLKAQGRKLLRLLKLSGNSFHTSLEYEKIIVCSADLSKFPNISHAASIISNPTFGNPAVSRSMKNWPDFCRFINWYFDIIYRYSYFQNIWPGLSCIILWSNWLWRLLKNHRLRENSCDCHFNVIFYSFTQRTLHCASVWDESFDFTFEHTLRLNYNTIEWAVSQSAFCCRRDRETSLSRWCCNIGKRRFDHFSKRKRGNLKWLR